MSIKNLRYWVFTSGENGIHGLDWGVKHASEYFADRQKLDTDYRALLKDFGLPPSLERPADEVGLILLSWNKSDYIAGFIFAGMDHGDRPNTSSVICVIPGELVGRKSVNETLKSVWGKNNIAEIARKNAQHRPDTLRLEGDSLVAGNAPYFRSPVNWPGINNGWLQIDGKQRELSRVNAVTTSVVQEEIKPSGGKLKIIVALVAAVITFSAVKYFSSHSVKTETSGSTPPKVSDNVKGGPNQSGSHDTPPAIPGGNEDLREAKIRELREKLTKFLAGTEHHVREKDFTVLVRTWDDEKESLFSEIKSKINTISLNPKKPKPKPKHNDTDIEVIFSLSVSGDIDNDKIIEAILNQYKEDKY